MKIIPTDTYLNGIYPSNNLYLDVFDFWPTLPMQEYSENIV